MKDERDSQRQRVYATENTIPSFDRQLNPQGRTDMREVLRFVKRVFRSKRVQKRWPFISPAIIPEIYFGDGRGRRSACAGTYHLKVPPFARTEQILCHELAHLIHRREDRWMWGQGLGAKRLKGYRQGHGWRFCQIYLDLVLLMMGNGTYRALKAAFKHGRVKTRTPRLLTDAQRAELRERGRVLHQRMVQTAEAA